MWIHMISFHEIRFQCIKQILNDAFHPIYFSRSHSLWLSSGQLPVAVICGDWWHDLVGGWVSTHLKNMIVKLDHETPRIGVKIPKIFELPPPSDFRISWPLHNTRIRDKLGCSLPVTHHGYGCSHLQRKSRQGFSDGKLRRQLAGLNWKHVSGRWDWPFHAWKPHVAITM